MEKIRVIDYFFSPLLPRTMDENWNPGMEEERAP